MIIGLSEMITQSPQVYGDKLPPALLADIAAIQRNRRRLTRLVNDVLDLSQVEAGRMALGEEWASVQEIIDEAALADGCLHHDGGGANGRSLLRGPTLLSAGDRCDRHCWEIIGSVFAVGCCGCSFYRVRG